MGHRVQTVVLNFVGALCLLYKVTPIATEAEPVDGLKMIQPGLDAKLADTSNQSFNLEEMNITEEFINFESLLPNDTVEIPAAGDRPGVRNESISLDFAENDAVNSSTNETLIKSDDETLADDGGQISTASARSDVNGSSTTTPSPEMSRMNRLRLQRQLRRLQRLQYFQREIPRRLGFKRPPKVSEEMKQRVLEIMAQDNGFPQQIKINFKTNRCYRAVCALPNGTDSRLWNDLSQPSLRLFSPLPKISRRSAKNIDGARLKLFVNPRQVVYRRKFLSDIRVPREGNVFIALDITSAVKTWMIKSRRNFGLEVTVQDANKTFLDARTVFGLPNCNSPSERSCRDDDGKLIEFIRFSGSLFGANIFPFETAPYVDVVSLNEPEDQFEKYTLHPRRYRRQIRTGSSIQPTRDNIAMLLSQQLTAKRQKARRLRHFGNMLRNQGKTDSNAIVRQQFALNEDLRLPGAGSSISFPSKPHVCDCSNRKSTATKELITTTTESSVTVKSNNSLADAQSHSALSNVTSEKNNKASSFVKQNGTDFSEPGANTNSTNTSQEGSGSNSSNQTANSTSTSTLEWTVILRKLHRREPLCQPKRIEMPIKDKKIIAPKVFSTLECPSSCKICKGKQCVRQICSPSAYSPVLGLMILSSGQIVRTALPGYSTVTKCHC